MRKLADAIDVGVLAKMIQDIHHCAVLDILDSSIKRDLVDWFFNLQLRDYGDQFAPQLVCETVCVCVCVCVYVCVCVSAIAAVPVLLIRKETHLKNDLNNVLLVIAFLVSFILGPIKHRRAERACR